MGLPFYEPRGGGWVVLAGKFPPTLNKENDPIRIQPNESPSSYGIAWASEDYLRSGTVPTGTARFNPTRSVGGNTYSWYYKRLCRASADKLIVGSPNMDDVFLAQNGISKIPFGATVLTFFPCLGDGMMVITASGSHLLTNCADSRGLEYFQRGELLKDFYTANAAYATVLNDIPYVCNAKGVFSYDGREVKELTRAVRDSIGNFASVAILADYDNDLIIGTNKFAIDTKSGKLFDYGTSGFYWESRVIAQSFDYNPFDVQSVAFVIHHASTAGGKIGWSSKTENTDWYEEQTINIPYQEGKYTRIEAAVARPIRTGYRFQIKLNSLSSNIYIREIQVCLQNFDLGTYTE
jgi:hypothetical protein